MWLLRLVAVASLMSATVRPAVAAGCDSGHMVETVSDDGSILKLEDGSVWSIALPDQADVAVWLPSTDIVICDGRLINTDDAETADAEPVAPPRRPSAVDDIPAQSLGRARAYLAGMEAERRAQEEARQRQLYDPKNYGFAPNAPVTAAPLQSQSAPP